MPLEMNCVNCGSTLKITEWGPNRICPFCGQNTVNVDIKEVHVFFGGNHSQSFEYFIGDEALDTVLKRNRKGKIYMGIDYHYVSLYYELCIGNISDPPYSNDNYYAHHYGSHIGAWALRERAFGKLDSVDSTVPIYLWLSDNEANEYMNLLYFASVFKCFENVFLVKWNHTEKNFDDAKFTMIKALERKIKLSTKDLEEFSSRFAEIQGWNSECLVGNSETVEPWLFSRVEEYVLSCMTDKYRTLGSIYSDVFKAVKKDTSFHIGYHMVEEAIHRLMMTGKIKSQGACMWWGETCYNNMLCAQSFRKEERQPQNHSYYDALVVVRDAFEFGYTYPLYDLLDDASSLVVKNHTIIGKWDIIEYIENSGTWRVHCREQKVTCDIAKVVEGKEYQKDDIYLMLCYEEEETYDYWLVKVIFGDNIIRSIEVSKPQGGLKLVAVDL